MNGTEIVDWICNELDTEEKDFEKMAQRLTEIAIEKNSTDNVSVIIVLLK